MIRNNHYETNSLANSILTEDTISFVRTSRKNSEDYVRES